MRELQKLTAENPFSQAPVYYREETESTMLTARELSQLPDWISGTAVAAGHQRSGRGRGDRRRWESAAGESLLMTLSLGISALSCPVSAVPLLSGLGTALFIQRQWSIPTLLKWPNDVIAGNKKVSGILCIRSGEILHIGIGINLLQRSFSEDLMKRTIAPTSILLEGGEVPPGAGSSPQQLSPFITGLLNSLCGVFSSENWQEQLEKRLYGRTEQVLFVPGPPDGPPEETCIEGILDGVTHDGGIRIGGEVYHSGEIRSLSGSGNGQIRPDSVR
jgi:hypothetical protein